MLSADVIYHNARIYTLDPEDRVASALAVRGDRIVATGGEDEVRQFAGRQTRWVDLGGDTVIPGIVDSHNHVIHGGIIMAGVMLFSASTIDDLKDMVAERVAEKKPGEWILGGGWIENQFKEWRFPTRWDLDQVSPDNPVLLRRLFGMSVVNSRALEMAGITAATADPAGGTIDRDPATGEPTGVLRDRAQDPVTALILKGSLLEETFNMESAISLAMDEYVKWGITSVVDPGVRPAGMRAYQNLYLDGRLPIRVNMMPAWHGLDATRDEANLSDRLDHLGLFTGLGDSWLRVGALKMAIDGGLGSKTSLMYDEFLDGSQSQVPLRLNIERLEEYMRAGHSRGWSIGIHTCGDKAQDLATAAFESILKDQKDTGLRRHNIIHGYFPTAQSLERMARHRIAVSAQPGFIWVEGDLYLTAVSEDVAARFKPLKTYQRHGILVACNSDMTSAHYNPFWGMHSTLTRQTARGKVLGEDECLDARETLRAFTLNGAVLMGEERDKGSLEPGKLADFAVLDRDILNIPPNQVRHTRVLTTVVGGRVAYQR